MFADLIFLNWLALIAGLLIFIIMMTACIVSIFEKEYLAARRSLLVALFAPPPFFMLAFNLFGPQNFVMGILLVFFAGFLILPFVPFGQKKINGAAIPQKRIDERDIMFSRRLLRFDRQRFEEYYKANPDKKKKDNKFRTKPGLLDKKAKLYDPLSFAVAEANFKTVACFHALVEGKPVTEKVDIDAAAMTHFVKSWVKSIGALSVGIAELQDYHFYSTIGRGPKYGEAIQCEHKYGIALTVEMDKEMLSFAPAGPTLMESSQQYLISGAIATQVAEFIRRLGYPARAHIDGNYRVVCPLVARDAGLGEIGRMGLLISPELGPRVRIAVITTDLPLVADKRKLDASVIDFCRKCKKCADVCPPRAIPFSERKEIDGVERWQINSENCFTYWCTIGTDCGRCIRTCPYSHPNNLLHNSVRWAVGNSAVFRKIAVWMDDFLYGRKPEPRPLPAWMFLQQSSKGKSEDY